jgi:HSP20 family protein
MLSRWDPYREMSNFRRLVNRMMEAPDYQEGDWTESMAWDLPLDVTEDQDEFLVKASLPGVNPNDLDITYNNNTLTIRGEMNKEEEQKEKRYLMRERHYGTFVRSISLPSSVNSGAIEAEYNDGILTLHLPKTEEVKPKRIAIRGGNKMIEGSTKTNQTSQKR